METKDWISTKDRLPEANNQIDNCTHCSDEVLICLNNKKVVIGKFYKIGMNYITYWLSALGEYKYQSDSVTHWMDIVLPEKNRL